MVAIVADAKFKTYLVALAFILFSISVVGIFWLLASPGEAVTVALSYAAGLSMIFLPCTLPLVFIIVPMSMGKGYKKGFLMALLFGIGLAITLTFYGVFVASVGAYIGMNQAVRVMFGLAGGAAFVFGLSELKLMKYIVPGFSFGAPKFIRERGDYLKSFLMGLFLGNAGVGCPNPAFYVLLAYIATVGSVTTGGVLGLVHGLGRATPLIFLSILAILGINATNFIVKKKESIERGMGWALVIIGAFILQYGLFGMAWWEESAFHKGWNLVLEKYLPQIAESGEIEERLGIVSTEDPVLLYGPWIVMGLLISFAIFRDYFASKRGVKE